MRTDETDGRTGRQTGMTNLRVAFRNFANAPKEIYVFSFEISYPYKDYKCLKFGSEDGGWSPGTDSRTRMFYGKSRLIVVCGARNDDDDNDDDSC